MTRNETDQHSTIVLISAGTTRPGFLTDLYDKIEIRHTQEPPKVLPRGTDTVRPFMCACGAYS